MPTRITLKQLQYFVSLAQTRHFREAAEQQGVTQPSLSAQIAGLEHTLGFQVIERAGGKLVLTPGGREIHARALRILDEVRGLEDAASALTAGNAGVLNVGVSSTIGPYLMAFVVRDLHLAYPALGLFVREGAPRRLEQELLSGEHDIILSQLPLNSSDINTQPLFREPLLVVVAADHGLAALESIQDADLSGQPVLTLGREFALNDMVAALCLETGAEFRGRYEGTSLDALRYMISSGMGAGFLPALYVQSEIEGRDPSVRAIPFRNGRVTRTMGFAWRKSTGQAKAISLFAEEVRKTTRRKFGNVVTMV